MKGANSFSLFNGSNCFEKFGEDCGEKFGEIFLFEIFLTLLNS
jgi:hypothetical protein